MEIELCGYKVLIDDEDYERVCKIKWHIKDKKKAEKGQYYFCYTDRKNGRKTLYLHRYIMNCDKYNGKDVDHINGDRLDNRKSNLRICQHSLNTFNQLKSSRNKTGYKGVHVNKDTKKYVAQIGVAGRTIYLGSFSCPQEAHDAYCEASKKYHGEYGRTE